MSSVRDIKGIGEKTQKLLLKLHIETIEDLLHHYPRYYTTYPEPVSVSEIQLQQRCSILCELSSPVRLQTVRSRKICSCLAADPTGEVFLRWFNMPYLKHSLKMDEKYIFTGIPVFKNGRIMMEQPEINTLEKYMKLQATFQPIYPLTAGLSNKTLQKSIAAAEKMYEPEEFLPHNLREYYDLMEEKRALVEIHFPSEQETLGKARRRIIFDEFFRFFSALELVKEKENQVLNHYVIPMGQQTEAFVESLPFRLTNAQMKALRDIRNDLSGTMAMNRMIQGDVGSGKTVVAMTAMLAVVKAGCQTALMAPTEVLANQHYETFQKMLSRENIKVGLLTGSQKASEKREIKEKIRQGLLDVVIGTHALIQEDVVFHKLALVVTDEQHRFGVKQRDFLYKKGEEPHVLVMSATPIPRSLGLILYRDLDVSIIDEVPASRLPIKNCVIEQNARQTAWNFIRKEINKGHQAYIICPMIEGSEGMDAENVIQYSAMLSRYLPGIRVESLNGKMSSDLKNEIMDRFGKGEIQILVSTTVIEVGIDVPNATVILIENAERFGLAQLHQLRGRVGRGKSQSYCIFISGSRQKEALERLSVVAKSNDGFYIAGEDLKIRGPGEFFGTKQSGTMHFALGDIYSNADILKEASEAVDHLKEAGYNFRKIHQYSLEEDLNFAKNL